MPEIRAIIVDEDESSRQQLLGVLSGYGYKVYATDKYEVAIRAFILLKPKLVFLDQDLYGLNGLEVAYFIRQLTWGRYATICLYTHHEKRELVADDNYRCINKYIRKDDMGGLSDFIEKHTGADRNNAAS